MALCLPNLVCMFKLGRLLAFGILLLGFIGFFLLFLVLFKFLEHGFPFGMELFGKFISIEWEWYFWDTSTAFHGS